MWERNCARENRISESLSNPIHNERPDPKSDIATELIAVKLNRNDGFVLKSWTGNCAYFDASGNYLGMLPESLPDNPDDWITDDTIYVKCLQANRTYMASATTEMAVLAEARVEGAIPESVFETVSAAVTASVKLLDMRLFGVRFVSDHGVLRDETTDWATTGSTYSDILPEWCKNHDTGAVRNIPISHTKFTKIDVKALLECKYQGPALEGRLYGNRNGDNPAFRLSATCQIQPTGEATVLQVFAISADGPLINNIATLEESIHWQFQVDSDGPVIDLGYSGPHKTYVTYGVPDPPEECSDIRLRTACEWADGVTSIRDIADAVGPDATSGFNPRRWYPTEPWRAMEDGADCITLVKLMQSAMGLLGVPAGDRGEVFFIYAQHIDWNGLRSTGVSQFETKEFGGLQYHLKYKNPNHGMMNWEACLYIDGYDNNSSPSTIKKYWMGGTGMWRKKAVDVLVDRAGPAGSARQWWVRTGEQDIGPVDYPGNPSDCPEPPP